MNKDIGSEVPPNNALSLVWKLLTEHTVISPDRLLINLHIVDCLCRNAKITEGTAWTSPPANIKIKKPPCGGFNLLLKAERLIPIVVEL